MTVPLSYPVDAVTAHEEFVTRSSTQSLLRATRLCDLRRIQWPVKGSALACLHPNHNCGDGFASMRRLAYLRGSLPQG